jgi:hypothetical protein
MPVPVLAVVAVLASIAVVAAAAGVNHLLTARTVAADTPAVNMNCTLIVPANPLTAQGLATPYQLTATDPANGPCNEANPNQTAFVQGAVINPATGQISVYDPLVVDAGTQPAAQPVVPTLPGGGVVALWFGFNGNTLSLAGPDQVPPSASQSATSASASVPASATTTPATASASASASASQTPTASQSLVASQPPTASQTPSASSPTAAGTGTSTATPTATGTAPAAAQAVGAAPLPPGSSGDSGYSATLTQISQSGGGQAPAGNRHRHPASPTASPSASASVSASAPVSASPSVSASDSGSVSPSASPTGSPTGSVSATPAGGDAPAASGNPDAVLQQANCVAGEDMGGKFSSFTQVGACNAVAFFAAANAAISAGRLRVPPPGTASDGMKCLTTRSFALVDQDQSDNVTTEYLTRADGQTAQDTAANRQSLTGAATLFNGSDNGLLDLFVDPALGCSPWEVPNLADGGAPAPALPLDELQAARYAGGRGDPAALVPLNDPMTLDGNGQFAADKTNTYRSLVDMPSLPAGESPPAYCRDLERIQGARLQQDVNLLTGNPGPAPAAADNLFTFLAMRLQQSFTNLNCASYGLRNDVSTTVDANGVVVAACFLDQVAPVTGGAGNPTAGMTTCPATTSQSSAAATPSLPPVGSAPSATASAQAWQRHHPRHHHWWW